jgi:hypothetical protein
MHQGSWGWLHVCAALPSRHEGTHQTNRLHVLAETSHLMRAFASFVEQHVAPVRKSLGVRTAFNILGPMLNPAVSAPPNNTCAPARFKLRSRFVLSPCLAQKATHALVGVYTPELLGLMAESLQASKESLHVGERLGRISDLTRRSHVLFVASGPAPRARGQQHGHR